MTVTSSPLDLGAYVWPDQTVRVVDALFPADGTVGDVAWSEVKVFLCATPSADGSEPGYGLLVLNSQLDTVLDQRVTEITDLGRSRRLTLDTGDQVEYRASRKCGCGSRLRGFRPWPLGVRVNGVPRPPLPWIAS